MAKIKMKPFVVDMWKLVPLNESPIAPKEVDAKTLKWINSTFEEMEEVQLFLEKLYKDV